MKFTIKLFFVLLATFQDNPYSGTFTSAERTLQFLDNQSCTITVRGIWGAFKEQKLKWRVREEGIIELVRFGEPRFTFRVMEIDDTTYLVDVNQLEDFIKGLELIDEEPPDISNPTEYDKYLIAVETVRHTLRQ